MIAEPASRRKGIAREALTIMMAYAADHLVRFGPALPRCHHAMETESPWHDLQGMRRFVAKIGEANMASQKLFRELQYREVGRSAVFHEVTFELILEDCSMEQLAAMKGISVGAYEARI
jgi:RimJ/RimL family protein N-acetyltransferase